MTRRTRRILFIIFVLVFLIATPGVLFYAVGYSIDWQNSRLIKTGAFYFDGLPRAARIFINGQQSNLTPSFVSRLAPAQYLVQIRKDGFTAWQKNLSVQEQITTEARNILLIPQNLQIKWVSDSASSTGKYFLTPAQKSAEQQVANIATSTLKDFASQTVYQDSLYILKKPNLILYRANLSGALLNQLSAQPLPTSTPSYQIRISPGQIAVFQDMGKLYLLNPNDQAFHLLADGVRGAEFSTDNEKLLWWTNDELWVLWLKDVFSQPYRKAGEKELITRYSEKIIQATWFAKTNEHIIYAVAGSQGQSQIKITELDSRDQRNTYDIWTAKNPEIYWNQDDNLLYILTSDKLYSSDIIQAGI